MRADVHYLAFVRYDAAKNSGILLVKVVMVTVMVMVLLALRALLLPPPPPFITLVLDRIWPAGSTEEWIMQWAGWAPNTVS